MQIEVPDGWRTVRLYDLAAKGIPNSFVDGDWVESPYITDRGIRLLQTGNIGEGGFIEKASKKFISANQRSRSAIHFPLLDVMDHQPSRLAWSVR